MSPRAGKGTEDLYSMLTSSSLKYVGVEKISTLGVPCPYITYCSMCESILQKRILDNQGPYTILEVAAVVLRLQLQLKPKGSCGCGLDV